MEYLNYELSNDNLSLDIIENYSEDVNLIVEWLRPYNFSFTDEERLKEIERLKCLNMGRNKLSNEEIKYYFRNEMVYEKLRNKR